jgi:hypothetical protein
MIGMKLDALTPELVDKILNLYGQVCEVPKTNIFWRRNSQGWTGLWYLGCIRDALALGNCAEWRLGSGLPGKYEGSFDEHAKFVVWAENDLIRFSFDPNIIVSTRAEAMANKFRIAVESLLQEHGLGLCIR